MRTKILVVAFAGLSLLAAAQTQSNEKKNTSGTATEVKAPRDLATGQASGKVASKGVIHRDIAAREASSGMATGRVAVGDVNGDGHADRTAGSGYNVKNQTGARVAHGDVNGDGAADATASNTSSASTKGTTTTTQTGAKSPREASSGMPTGKRQHEPITITK